MIIYKITCKLNGMGYVGKTTKTLKERMKWHRHNKRHSLIDADIRKYGIDNFTVEVLAECVTIGELDRLERKFIHECDCIFPNGYNLIGYGIKPKERVKILLNITEKPNVTKAPIFDKIYLDLKNKIEMGEYPFNLIFPTEHELSEIYSCMRSTIRRALALLIEQGYIQSRQGKRARVIYEPVVRNTFLIGGIESFKEAAMRNKFKHHTRVIRFDKISVDRELSIKTGFPIGTKVYDVRRVRYLNDKPLILDKNIFLISAVGDLNEEIAKQSIYEYLENELKMSIVTSKRRMTVELATSEDNAWLELDDYNCLAVLSGRVFNSDGIQFEYTESRHRPDYFCFEDTATRHKFKG